MSSYDKERYEAAEDRALALTEEVECLRQELRSERAEVEWLRQRVAAMVEREQIQPLVALTLAVTSRIPSAEGKVATSAWVGPELHEVANKALECVKGLGLVD